MSFDSLQRCLTAPLSYPCCYALEDFPESDIHPVVRFPAFQVAGKAARCVLGVARDS